MIDADRYLSQVTLDALVETLSIERLTHLKVHIEELVQKGRVREAAELIYHYGHELIREGEKLLGTTIEETARSMWRDCPFNLR